MLFVYDVKEQNDFVLPNIYQKIYIAFTLTKRFYVDEANIVMFNH